MGGIFAVLGRESAVLGSSVVASRRSTTALVIGALLLSLLAPTPAVATAPANSELAARSATRAQEVRTVWASDLGTGRPGGVTYAPDRNELLVAAGGADGTEVVRLGFDEDVLGRFVLPRVDHVSTLAYDARRRVLTVVDGTDRLEAKGSDLEMVHPDVTPVDVSALGLSDPAAAGFDPASDDWVVVDATDNTVVRDLGSGTSSLRSVGADAGGLGGPAAFNSTDGLLYVLTQNERSVLVLDEFGAVEETIDVSAIDFVSPVAMTFAPSSDRTDDSANMSLFVADAGDAGSLGGVVEVSLAAEISLAADPVIETATLVRQVETSLWVPGSPDPSGVVYLPGDDVLTVVDSEVDETTGAGYHDVNMWMANQAGLVVGTGTTWTSSVGGYPEYSNEPTGLGYDAATDRLFVSDDRASGVHVVGRGADGSFGTGDDVLGFVETATGDVEDPEVVDGILYQLDGASSEIYRIDPVDGVFGNPDDVMTSFDIGYLGPSDWEGLASDPTRGTLYVGARTTQQIFEVTTGGALVRTIEVDVVGLRYISGLATILNPGGALSFFIVDRGTDNSADSNENDGVLFEVQVGDPVPPSNLPPVVDAGADFFAVPGTTVATQGTVIDDGLPTGATVTQLWSVDPSSPLSDVTFMDPTVLSTGATFGTDGVYVLTLTADDSDLSASDTVMVTVSSANAVPVVDAGPDQAVVLPAGVVLEGSASDGDGPGPLTVLWTGSGPGLVSFADDADVGTAASFSTDGVYVLTLTADDSDLSASDTAMVTVSSASAVPAGSFTDDNGNIHEGSIEAIAAVGITKGCNPPTNDRYCPSGAVTRGQMAAFIRRTLKLPASPTDFFRDDDGSVFEGDINAVAAAGITKGCNPPVNDLFCPDESVTREQMAAFLRRAFAYPPSSIDFFTDDHGSLFEADINAIGAAGVTKGCNPPTNNKYCPKGLVLRDQMASFFARALGLPPINPPPP